MRITCPYCQSDARLSSNPEHPAQDALPVYRLSCSGCDRTSVRPDNQELLLVALVGTRHGCGEHELTVTAEETRSIRFHSDPSGQRTPVVEHSALLEAITRGAGNPASDINPATFTNGSQSSLSGGASMMMQLPAGCLSILK